MAPSTERPLRRDAERNRQRILAAAADLFAVRGIDVTLNEIARHAGVGVGTVYRRFPDRDGLIVELFEQKVERLVELTQAAAKNPDPWRGLVDLVEGVLELNARDRALRDLMFESPHLQVEFPIRDRLMPLIDSIVARAKEAGELRGDVQTSDLMLMIFMFFPILDGARETKPDLWRRFVPILMRGLRVDPGSADPLPVPALHAAQLEAVMAQVKSPGC